MRRLTLGLLIVASAALLWMLNEIGWARVGREFLKLGCWWPLLLLPYGLVNYLTALSWRYLLLTGQGPSMTRLFFLRLAGESINQLTPTASMGGEPYKAVRLQASGVPWEDATASVVIQKGIMVLSLVLYVFFGLALIPFMLPGAASHLGLLTLGAVILAFLGVTFVVVQGKNPCVSTIRFLDRFGLCPARLKAREEDCAGLDARLSGFYREHPGRCLAAFLLVFIGWPLHAAEVYLFFRLIDYPVSWVLALSLDALTVLCAALGFMIPASVGVQDLGTILLALGFNLGAALGAAFSIVRRLREIFWLALGLVVVARER